MQGVDLTRIVEIVDAEQTLDFGHAAFGECHRAALFVDRIIALGVDGGASSCDGSPWITAPR
jgi:hypothetical protein